MQAHKYKTHADTEKHNTNTPRHTMVHTSITHKEFMHTNFYFPLYVYVCIFCPSVSFRDLLFSGLTQMEKL